MQAAVHDAAAVVVDVADPPVVSVVSYLVALMIDDLTLLARVGHRRIGRFAFHSGWTWQSAELHFNHEDNLPV